MMTAKMLVPWSRRNRSRRAAFTLVELMVVCALCVIIMAVMASIFSTGTEAVRQIHSAGEMMDQLRAAGEVIKTDLQGTATDHKLRIDHFAPSPIPNVPSDRRRLSDYRFHYGEPAPIGGCFRIVSTPTIIEGVDADGLQSGRATNHQLHFTTILPGGKDQNQFSARLTNGVVYTSRAAEIAYFLVQDPIFPFTSGPGSTPLYQLIRRQRLVAMTDADQTLFTSTVQANTAEAEVISARVNPGPPPAIVANTLADITNPANRINGGNTTALPGGTYAPLGAANGRIGDDVLLSNVISFEVKPTWDASVPAQAPRSFPPAPFTQIAQNGTDDPNLPANTYSTDAPYDNLGKVGSVFDTGATPAPTIRVKSVQIRVRIYDAKMKNARQSTFVVDL